MAMQYISTESGRAGLCSWSNGVSAENVGDSLLNGVNPSEFESLLDNSVRVPQTSLEVKWKPDRCSGNWFDNQVFAQTTSPINSTAFPMHTLATNGCMVQLTAGPATASVFRVEFTTVYEWKPTFSSGVSSAGSRSRSSNKLDDVINSISDQAWTMVMGMGKSAIDSMLQNMGGLAINRSRRLGAPF
jgi:hypothetical protein